MRKILGLTLAFVLMANSAFGSPLVFKTSKTTSSNELTEIGTFDTSKYRQIRIAIKFSGEFVVSERDAKLKLASAQRSFKSTEDLFSKGVVSKAAFDRENEYLKQALSDYENSKGKNNPQLNIYAIENNDELLFQDFDNGKNTNTFVIDSPPSKISVKVSGKGQYNLYIWASQ